MGDFHPVPRKRAGIQVTLTVLNKKHLKIVSIPKKNKGLKSTVDIPEGNYVCEYKGDLITNEEVCFNIRSHKSLTIAN